MRRPNPTLYCPAARKPKLATRDRKGLSGSFSALLASPAQPRHQTREWRKRQMVQPQPSSVNTNRHRDYTRRNQPVCEWGWAPFGSHCLQVLWNIFIDIFTEHRYLKCRVNELDWRCRPENLERVQRWFLAPAGYGPPLSVADVHDG